jgi:hypothetical protein
MTKALLRMIMVALALVIAFIIFSPKNHSQLAPQPQPLPEPALTHAEKQVSDAASDPDKAELMQCMGVNTKEGNAALPSEEECKAVAQRLGEKAGETPEEIKNVQDQLSQHQ